MFTNYHVRRTLAEAGNGILNVVFIPRAGFRSSGTEKRIVLEIREGNRSCGLYRKVDDIKISSCFTDNMCESSDRCVFQITVLASLEPGNVRC
jgi:hypothetical protein